jgi:hypothetical protein
MLDAQLCCRYIRSSDIGIGIGIGIGIDIDIDVGSGSSMDTSWRAEAWSHGRGS